MRSTMQDFPLTIGVDPEARHRPCTATPRWSPRPPTAPAAETYAELGKRAARLANAPALAGHRRRPAGRHLPVEQRRAPRGLPRRSRRWARCCTPSTSGCSPSSSSTSPTTPRTRSSSSTTRSSACSPSSCPRSKTVAARAGRRPRRRVGRPRLAARRAARRCCSTTTCSPTQPRTFDWPEIDERRRRGDVLHQRHHRQPQGRRLQPPLGVAALAWRSAPATSAAISFHDRVLPIVPMFHANAWGLAYAALMTGASLCMPDRWLQAEPLCRFMNESRPTVSGAVPTVWNDVLGYLDEHPEIEARVAPADPVRRLRRARLAAEGAPGAARHRRSARPGG